MFTERPEVNPVYCPARLGVYSTDSFLAISQDLFSLLVIQRGELPLMLLNYVLHTQIADRSGRAV
jgi:hypothetical protein